MDHEPSPRPGERLRRPWRRSTVFFAALAAALLITFAVTRFLGGRLLAEVKLRGERRSTTGEHEVLSLAPGERLRLEVALGKPAAILVFLEDPEGALSEIHPPEGDAPLLPGPSVRLPEGDEGAWNSAGLLPGNHFLWIYASPGPIPPEERAAVRTRIEGLIKDFPPPARRSRDWFAAREERLGRGDRQSSCRWFWVPGR